MLQEAIDNNTKLYPNFTVTENKTQKQHGFSFSLSIFHHFSTIFTNEVYDFGY